MKRINILFGIIILSVVSCQKIGRPEGEYSAITSIRLPVEVFRLRNAGLGQDFVINDSGDLTFFPKLISDTNIINTLKLRSFFTNSDFKRLESYDLVEHYFKHEYKVSYTFKEVNAWLNTEELKQVILLHVNRENVHWSISYGLQVYSWVPKLPKGYRRVFLTTIN